MAARSDSIADLRFRRNNNALAHPTQQSDKGLQTSPSIGRGLQTNRPGWKSGSQARLPNSSRLQHSEQQLTLQQQQVQSPEPEGS